LTRVIFDHGLKKMPSS